MSLYDLQVSSAISACSKIKLLGTFENFFELPLGGAFNPGDLFFVVLPLLLQLGSQRVVKLL